MFLSIPKEFFVEVIFSSNFKLNTKNNNMEYDSIESEEKVNNDVIENKHKEEVVERDKEDYRVREVSVKEAIKYKCKIEIDEFLENNDDSIYVNIDDEYIDDSVKIEDGDCE